MAINIDAVDAEIIGKVLSNVQEALDALKSVEAWLNLPIDLGSELVGGLDGVIDYHDDGKTLVFIPSEG